MNAVAYSAATTSPEAREAEARTHGALRGGYVVGDRFYTMAGLSPVAVPLSDVRDLRYPPYT